MKLAPECVCLDSILDLYCSCIFFQKTQSEIQILQNELQDVEQLGAQMAQRFCEDKTKFKIEECLDIYKTFCENIHKCQKVSVLCNNVKGFF